MKLPLPYLITLALITTLYWPVVPELFRIWTTDPFYSHGLIIPLLSGYFLWKKRDEIKNTGTSFCALGIPVALFGLALYLFGKVACQIFPQALSIPITIFGAVLTQMGWGVGKIAAFPIFYLLFSVPLHPVIITFITFKLRLMSTIFAYSVLQWIGITCIRHGNIISLANNRSMEIADACSGLSSLITFMAAALAIGYLYQKSVLKKIILFILSIAIAVIMNMVRLVSEAILISKFNIRLTQNIDYGIGGALLIIGALILFAINGVLKKK